MKRFSARSLRLARVIFTAVVIVAVTYFIVKTLSRNWSNISSYDLRPNVYSVAGTLCFVLSVMTTGLFWGRILERLGGKPVTKMDAIRVQISSWLLKYVPGQVGSYAGKLTWGTREGFTKKDVTISFMYENILLLTSSLITTLPIMALVFFNQVGANFGRVVPLLIALPLFAISIKPVFYRVMNFLLKLIRKKPLTPEYFLDFKELFLQQLAFLIPRLLIGLGFVLICKSVVPVSPSMFAGLGATYILAGIIGILALFVPSGIGVREGIIILFASVYFNAETATLVALLARFYATIADVILALMYVALTRLSRKKA
jgi:glycosyltransferase 2 family protein